MSAPKFLINANQKDSSGFYTHQTSPGWCVAFVRFKNPVCGFSKKEELMAYKEVLIVEDDAVSVTVSNSKNSYTKSCRITLKSGDVYYPNAVSPGDWVMVWMHEDQTKINEIVNLLKNLRSKNLKNNQLNDWQSGLKFVGRVSSVGASDSVSPRGVRTVTQSVNATAFLELSSSVYFTIANQAIYNFLDPASGASGSNTVFFANAKNLPRFGNFQSAFEDFFAGVKVTKDVATSGRTPDQTILFLIIYLMGISENSVLPETGYEAIRANFNDAILVPDFVASVCNIPKSNNGIKMWQLYNIYSGLQKYSNKRNTHWGNFSPDFKIQTSLANSNKIVFETGTRLKGFVPTSSPNFENVSFWEIFNQYLNPLLNEMYTCLRVDAYNRIKPTIVIREQPFGTGLYNKLITTDNKLEELQVKQAKAQKTSEKELPNKPVVENVLKTSKTNKKLFDSLNPELKQRAMYGNLPRWAIDESMVLGLNMSTDESRRINFLQVWGEAASSYNSILANSNDEKLANSQSNNLEILKFSQIALGNYIIDNNDITRNGLRAAVYNTDFDIKSGVPVGDGIGVTLAPLWAKMKADHLFNGHLKPTLSIECAGISAPIVEGDNLEIRNMVFHIESVTHSVSISGNGIKSFRTSILADNGIMAYSLENLNDVPVYPALCFIENVKPQNMVSLTDFEIQRDNK